LESEGHEGEKFLACPLNTNKTKAYLVEEVGKRGAERGTFEEKVQNKKGFLVGGGEVGFRRS